MEKENFYVFVSIDGVLFDSSWTKEINTLETSNSVYTFKPESILALNYLIEELEKNYNVELVITSPLQSDLQNIVKNLYQNGLQYNNMPHCIRKNYFLDKKSYEIENYLFFKPNNENFAIIDDKSFDFQFHFPSWKIIKPNAYRGNLSVEMVKDFLSNYDLSLSCNNSDLSF